MRMNYVWCLLVFLAEHLRSCTPSSASSSMTHQVLAEVESNLRTLFGFKGRPRVDRSKLVIPKALLDLYEKQIGAELDVTSLNKPGMFTQTANTVRSYPHVESPLDEKFSHHKFRLKFNVRNVPSSEQLKAAEITINRDSLVRLNEDKKSHLQRVFVIDIIRPGIKGKQEAITRLIDSKIIDVKSNKTLSVDVLPAVERWLKQPKSNYGVIISVKGVGNTKGKLKERHLRLKRDIQEDWMDKQPLLFIYTDDGRSIHRKGEEILNNRRKRAARNGRRRDEKREPCRRHAMRVDFGHVGWNDWIVAPAYYDAFHCKGECNFPFPDHLNTTNHAIVQSLINSVNPSKVPKPCCIPTQLSSISMLYVDDQQKVTLKNYRDMVVIGCGCR